MPRWVASLEKDMENTIMFASLVSKTRDITKYVQLGRGIIHPTKSRNNVQKNKHVLLLCTTIVCPCHLHDFPPYLSMYLTVAFWARCFGPFSNHVSSEVVKGRSLETTWESLQLRLSEVKCIKHINHISQPIELQDSNQIRKWLGEFSILFPFQSYMSNCA